MADSPNKRAREARERRKRQEKAERKRMRKEGLLPKTGPATWEELAGLKPPAATPPPPPAPPATP